MADVHRTIKYGGIFMYPSTADALSGMLRVVYECFPMAHIVENAGGLASVKVGRDPRLDFVPMTIPERSPIFLGSKDEVQDILDKKPEMDRFM